MTSRTQKIRPRHAPLGALLIAAILLTASGEGASSTVEASGDTSLAPTTSEPVTLRVGTDDEPGVPAADQIEEFARQVDELSGGGLLIEPVWRAGGSDIADWDQVVARMAVSGELDLAMIPARAWDTEGVTSLRAPHAPFLVTSDELLARIVTDGVADEMLGGLAGAGVTGLALVPEGMRHVFSFGDPLRSVADFNGATIRAPTSNTTHAALQALGATPDDFGAGDLFGSGVAAGTITAAESSFSFAGSLPDFTATAGNVTLFPKVNSLVINTERFDDLTDEQREILRNAALATRDWAISATVPDGDLARQFCEAGGRVVVASDAEVASLVQEVDDVYARLEDDPDTKRFIERIRDLSADVGAPQAIEPCGPPAAGPNVPSETPPSIVGGTEVRLVVDTQGGTDSSPVLSADGPLEACTSVTDLDATITELNPDVDVFSGEKRITCAGGEVTIRYDAVMNVSDPGVTSGTWSIVSSTLAGVSSGGGQLAGDPDDCDVLPGSDFCVLDTFTGSVAG